LAYREEQRKLLESDNKLSLGDVITVNLTMVSGGVQVNVVPAELTANFDIRVPPTKNLDEVQKMFESWCTEAGPGITFDWPDFHKIQAKTDISESNVWWKTFSNVLKDMKLEYETKVFFGGTDARYLRVKGISALGFSPMVNTPQLLHEHDEFLNENVFLKGLEIYTQLIPALANVA